MPSPIAYRLQCRLSPCRQTLFLKTPPLFVHPFSQHAFDSWFCVPVVPSKRLYFIQTLHPAGVLVALTERPDLKPIIERPHIEHAQGLQLGNLCLSPAFVSLRRGWRWLIFIPAGNPLRLSLQASTATMRGDEQNQPKPDRVD